MSSYKSEFNKLRNVIEEHLDKYIPIAYPQNIFESMRYSVLAGGKRLRPVITLEVARMLSGSFEQAIPTACAIEMLHTQSLIHDDLPCMDNDDYRRGKPTNHKIYGEAIATLAGDALLTFAPQVITKYTPATVSRDQVLAVLDEYFATAGAYGIIAGQVVDIESEHKAIDSQTLEYIHKYKTAKLFGLAFRAGAILGGADEVQLKDFTDIAYNFGHAFQIYDDILDEIATIEELGKTPGKDKIAEKNTYTSMFGIDKAKSDVYYRINFACDILKKYNYNSVVLDGIMSSIIERIS